MGISLGSGERNPVAQSDGQLFPGGWTDDCFVQNQPFQLIRTERFGQRENAPIWNHINLSVTPALEQFIKKSP
jgi:hypothetical protein